MSHQIGMPYWDLSKPNLKEDVDSYYNFNADIDRPPVLEITPEKKAELEKKYRSTFRILKSDCDKAASATQELNFLVERITGIMFNAVMSAIKIDGADRERKD